MKWWQQVKKRLYASVLQQRINHNFSHRLVNLKMAKTVAIFYDATGNACDDIIQHFAAPLRTAGKTVTILGYINDKKIDTKNGIAVFNKNHVNWYGVPIDTHVLSFTQQAFDILFLAITDAHQPLQYLAATSQATCRVGIYIESNLACCDLMAETNGNTDLPFVLAQMRMLTERI